MRNKFAVPLIVIGVLLMLIGIGQRTIWAPPETLSESATAESSNAVVTVLDEELLTSRPDVKITVRSDADFTLAVGRPNDVNAWVGEASANRIGFDGEVSVETKNGEATAPNPAGSDLWVVEKAGNGELTYGWEAPGDGEWAMLLAADGTAPAPADVTLTWDNDATRPLAVPLIIVGALLAVLGLALAFLRSGSDTRRGGRRSAGSEAASAGKEPSVSGSTSAFTATPAVRRRPAFLAAAAAAALVAGTAPAPALAAESDPAGHPVVLDSQVDRILESVAGTVAAADAAKDASVLAPRVTGSAYTMREANYAVAAKSAEQKAPVPVSAGELRTQSVSSAADWPRTVVAVTQGEDNPVPQALLLVQASARDNYKLVSAVEMLPASTFPPAPVPAADQIPADSDNGLAMSPQTAVDVLADAMSNPQGSNKDSFAANLFTKDVVEFQEKTKNDPQNEFARILFNHRSDPQATYSLRTEDGGALVFGYLANTFRSTPKEAGDSVNLEGTVFEALTGEASTDAGIDVVHGEAVMLYVPASGSSGQALVVGASQQLLSANLR